MWRWIKYTLVLTLVTLVLAFLHYTLPQRDVVRIVETEVRRVDFGENSIFWAQPDTGQDASGANRDVRFINAVLYKSGRVMVYRNEDTGWGWPPYFKLDSSNLQTEVADLVSAKAEPQWVVLTHYGWRNEFLSIFPNAVGVRATDDPDERLIPWFNILLLIIVAGLGLGLFRLSQWFKRTRIDPITESVGETWDAVDDYADEKRTGFRAWLDTWKGKPRK